LDINLTSDNLTSFLEAAASAAAAAKAEEAEM